MAQDVFARTAANRRVLADFYEGLDDDQLDAASLCDGWATDGRFVTSSAIW